MKLENQICSLELSKKLKKLGVEQKSLFYWTKDINKKDEVDLLYKEELFADATPSQIKELRELDDVYSAFTSAELGKRLDENLEQINWAILVDKNFKNLWEKSKGLKDEVNNRAKMLIYLLENKLIT